MRNLFIVLDQKPACTTEQQHLWGESLSYVCITITTVFSNTTSCCTGSCPLPVCDCLTAEVYIGMSKPAEASACTQEAANLFPTSHNVLYMKGQIAELRGNIDEAKRWYEEALSINPTHVKTMQRLVMLKTPWDSDVSSVLVFGHFRT